MEKTSQDEKDICVICQQPIDGCIHCSHCGTVIGDFKCIHCHCCSNCHPWCGCDDYDPAIDYKYEDY